MRRFRSPLSRMLILTLGLAAATVVGQGAPSPKAVPLFNGKTLDGWEGDLKIFRRDRKKRVSVHNAHVWGLRAAAQGQVARRQPGKCWDSVPD